MCCFRSLASRLQYLCQIENCITFLTIRLLVTCRSSALKSWNQSMMGANAVTVFLCLCVFRILNALLIQSQFDPDEYWQNLEPAYCEAFLPGKPCESYTWEWKRRPASLEYESISQSLNQSLEGPVRSYASVLPTYLFYRLIKIWELDTAWMVSKGPALLNAVIVAAPTDWAVWYMSRWIRSSARIQGSSLPWWCLFCSLVSWFNAYALVRTYSNSVETALLTLSLALVSPVRLYLQMFALCVPNLAETILLMITTTH